MSAKDLTCKNINTNTILTTIVLSRIVETIEHNIVKGFLFIFRRIGSAGEGSILLGGRSHGI